MSLSTFLAAIILNKTVCLPSITCGSNPAYNALYEVQFCNVNDSGKNILIVTVTVVFD